MENVRQTELTTANDALRMELFFLAGYLSGSGGCTITPNGQADLLKRIEKTLKETE
jgi:hypothetical protein|tara:strand:+ start:860 stop:1027 length:168 start_codon:yes stop_codon:yes gene_type:complete